MLKPSDTLKVTLAGDYYWTKDNTALQLFPVSVTPATRVVNGPLAGLDSPAGYPSLTEIKVWGVSGKIELETGIGMVTSITSYRKIRNESHFDVDGTATDLLHLDYHSGNETFQQELRLSSKTTEPLSWQLGMFYLHSRAFNDQFQNGLALRGNTTHIDSIGKTDSISVFGEATYAITPTTHLTGGIRYTSDHRKLLPTSNTATLVAATGLLNALVVPNPKFNAIDRVTYNETTFRVALRQDLSDKISAYVSVNRGFKAGQFNLQTPQDPPVKPQTIMAYEAGLKGDFLDNHLRLSIAGFHYDINDYQIRSSPNGVSLLANAAKVKIDGVDINAEAVLTSRFHVTAGAAWLNSRFASFPKAANPGANLALPSGDATGLQTALAPHFTLNLGGTYNLPLGGESELRFTANFQHKSSYVFEADNLLRQPAYDVVNGSIEYKINDHFAVEGYMRNIGNRVYNVQMVTSVGQAALSAAPRQYGLNFKVNY